MLSIGDLIFDTHIISVISSPKPLLATIHVRQSLFRICATYLKCKSYLLQQQSSLNLSIMTLAFDPYVNPEFQRLSCHLYSMSKHSVVYEYLPSKM